MLRSLIALGVITVVTVFIWIGLNIEHNLTTSKISLMTLQKVEPITPNFDKKALDRLAGRTIIDVNLSESTKITPKVSTTPSPSPTTSITPSTTQTPIPTLSLTPSPTKIVEATPTATPTPTP